jgi:hypothetical protein
MDREVIVVVEPENRTTALEDWQTTVLCAVCTVEREQRERRLALVVSKEEISG